VNSETFRCYRHRIALRAVSGGLVASVIVATAFTWPAALGLALGAGVSTLTFHLRGVQAEQIVALPPAAAERRARTMSLGRSACRVAALVLAGARPELSLPWAVGGLFAVPLTLAASRFADPGQALDA